MSHAMQYMAVVMREWNTGPATRRGDVSRILTRRTNTVWTEWTTRHAKGALCYKPHHYHAP